MPAAHKVIDTRIRTLGWYEPFCSLMIYGDKIETRWVKKGKKPPFPEGEYLMYTTKKEVSQSDLYKWCGTEIMHRIMTILGPVHENGKKVWKNGWAIGIGNLTEVRLLQPEDEEKAYVKYIGEQIRTNPETGEEEVYVQWALVYKQVKAIEPFEWKYGKQGIGFMPDSELHKIKPI